MREKLEEIKEIWVKERPIYKRLAQYVQIQIQKELLKKGIYSRVTSREKDLASLLKKVIRKGYINYEQIGDKAGVRVVVHFPRQIEIVESVIYKFFNVLDKDDKSKSLDYDKLGYQAIHYQIEIDPKLYHDIPHEFLNKSCEIQVRTICQDVWSEMYHLLAYKSEIPIPKEILREVHCLSAILEVGDKNFSQIENMIRELPYHYSINILNKLEGYFYNFIGLNYDRELSIEVIEHLKKCYSTQELQNFDDLISKFITDNLEKVKYVIANNKDYLIFMTQPEILIGSVNNFVLLPFTK